MTLAPAKGFYYYNTDHLLEMPMALTAFTNFFVSKRLLFNNVNVVCQNRCWGFKGVVFSTKAAGKRNKKRKLPAIR